MSTECYAMVRGAGLRVTGLDIDGAIPSPIRYAASKSVALVRINEVTEASSNEVLKNDDDERRLYLPRSEEMVQYRADIDFIRCDPGILSLVSNVPEVTNAAGDVVGFDANTRLTAAAFAMELWSRLAGHECDPSGQRLWGYTVLPFLKGGYLSGFEFKNGLVSFKLRNAQAKKVARWGVGPWDLDGIQERLLEVVSRNTLYKTTLTTAQPPEPTCGTQITDDVIYGGTATVTTIDVIDGGNATSTSPWIIYGGRAR